MNAALRDFLLNQGCLGDYCLDATVLDSDIVEREFGNPLVSTG